MHPILAVVVLPIALGLIFYTYGKNWYWPLSISRGPF
jgi:hypothetical protein